MELAPARLSCPEAERVRQFIDIHRLHAGGFPLPIVALATALGWTVRQRDIAPLWLSATSQPAKLIEVCPDLSPGARNAHVAFVLGRELLGLSTVGIIGLPAALNQHYPPYQLAADDYRAWAVAALLMIPERVAAAGFEADEVAALCHCPTRLARRRLHATVIEQPTLRVVSDGDVIDDSGWRIAQAGD